MAMKRDQRKTWMVWCGPSLKTPNLLGGFWWCPTPYPYPRAGRFDLSGAPLDVPCSRTFSKHLYLKLTRQSQAETSAASVRGVDRHHHLWPGQLLMSADGPSLRTRNSPSIWTRLGGRGGGRFLPGGYSHTPRKLLSGEHVFVFLLISNLRTAGSSE